MSAKPLLVFDMDGVLVDVGESYRETIRHTVYDFAGVMISHEQIQEYKNAGGWNNDWALSQKILADLGHAVPYETVVQHFDQIFLGHDGRPGLILREQWIATPGLLQRLAERFQLAIFTGRFRYELVPTLDRFARDLFFDPQICGDDVQVGKPDPEGLLAIAARFPGRPLLYVGDTVDDARSARAANVPFFGVASRQSPRREELIALLKAENAVAIVEDINQLETVLPA